MSAEGAGAGGGRGLFGTDGIRGRAGEQPLDPVTLERLGEVLVGILAGGAAPVRVLIGRDTRESGADLETWLRRGIDRAGGRTVLAGILPTPAIAHLTAAGGFGAGIVISASHNPFRDNGVKILSGRGYKLEDGLEEEIERRLLRPAAGAGGAPRAAEAESGGELAQTYLAHLLGIASRGVDYRRMRLALDCANGAAFRVAPQLFTALGMEVHVIGNVPDGRNINADCGSVHPQRVAALTREIGADLGLALDGDADRAILIDPEGRTVDGDQVLCLAARSWKRRGRLRGDGVVGTVMANQWLERELGREGLRLHRAPVGDRYVLQEMLARGCNVGGEPSGHCIFLDHATTGDGLLTTLMVLEAVEDLGLDLADWNRSVAKFPQRLVNLPAPRKPDLRAHPGIAAAIRAEEERLGDAGRVLVRYSGTEPLLRLMVEAERPDLVDATLERLAAALRPHLAPATGEGGGVFRKETE